MRMRELIPVYVHAVQAPHNLYGLGKDKREVNKMDRNDLPLGFSFALAQNPEAMQKFALLPEREKSEILQRANAVSSKEEMQALVDGLSAQ